ncbi:GNAT family N-acetyltransferase [Clostridium sp. Marseille-P299]|uniref:GNAT family N-acetyltransferase n=1 Tax=Clostridium sp. Marseille-P299 TaxID=1805477 RepID=UPI000A7A6045|nr:GNAT family N-acetyltransferase [Clostridium sp. Marseille-P299]
MNIKFKETKENDFERIKEIYASENWRAYLQDDEKLKRAFNNSLLCLGAYEEDKLFGFVRCVGDGEHIIVVQDLIVHHDYQKLGIGTQLFQYVLDKYKNVRMFLVITDLYDEVDNKFYQKNGLVKIEQKEMVAYVR